MGRTHQGRRTTARATNTVDNDSVRTIRIARHAGNTIQPRHVARHLNAILLGRTERTTNFVATP